MENLSQKQKIIVYVIGVIVFALLGLYTWKKSENVDYESIEEEILNIEIQEEEVIVEESEEIVIHVIGAVNDPGIVRLSLGSRIIDVIEAAGGSKEEADLNQVNLAYIVEDGQKIHIPSINEEVEEFSNSGYNEYISSNEGNNIIINNEGESQKVNINTASKEELMSLNGIGEATADKIIAYREENGKFNSIEDIQNVKGIGEAKFNNIKENICIK